MASEAVVDPGGKGAAAALAPPPATTTPPPLAVPAPATGPTAPLPLLPPEVVYPAGWPGPRLWRPRGRGRALVMCPCTMELPGRADATAASGTVPKPSTCAALAGPPGRLT